MTITLIHLPSVFAEEVMLFNDTSQSPYFTVYWDGSSLKIEVDNADNIQLKYQLDGKDYNVNVDPSSPEVTLPELPKKIWLMVVDGDDVNYYPDSRAGWGFAIADERTPQNKDEELVPTFSVPELPLGTIMAIVSMFAAILIYTKSHSLIKQI
jgi:hypothetical protein